MHLNRSSFIIAIIERYVRKTLRVMVFLQKKI